MRYPELNDYRDTPVLQDEVWKDIDGFEDSHQISNYGRVKGKSREVKSSNQYGDFHLWVDERVYTVHPDSKGYPSITLRNGDRKRVARVHRLVAEHFNERCEGCDIVHHKDNDIMNPNSANLEWTVDYKNRLYASEDGLYNRECGEDHHRSTHDSYDVITAYTMARKGDLSQERIAGILGMKQITISNIKTKKTWQHLTNQIDEILGLDFEW